jgi:hypothetical protein
MGHLRNWRGKCLRHAQHGVNATSLRQAPAGEVRVVNAEGGNQEVRVDLDGNGEADMEILVTAANTLRAGDFIL